MLRYVRTLGLVLSLFAAAAVGRAVAASNTAASDTEGLLQNVRWVGPPVSLDALHGKTVVVLDYATWCPICNGWSGEFLKQLHEAIEGRPIVVLAIDTDSSTSGLKQYVTQRNFFAPNIIHGYDPSIIKRANLPELWGFMIIGPDGKIAKQGHAGTFHEQGKEKKFVLPDELAHDQHPGEFTIMEADMSSALKQILWPIELGQASTIDATAKRKLVADEQKQLDAAMAKYLSKELAKVKELAAGQTDDRFAAYDRATALSSHFRNSAEGKEAHKVVQGLEGDAKFKREMLAKRAFDKCQQSTVTAAKKSTMLKTLAKRFDGTEYGEKAKLAAEEN